MRLDAGGDHDGSQRFGIFNVPHVAWRARCAATDPAHGFERTQASDENHSRSCSAFVAVEVRSANGSGLFAGPRTGSQIELTFLDPVLHLAAAQ